MRSLPQGTLAGCFLAASRNLSPGFSFCRIMGVPKEEKRKLCGVAWRGLASWLGYSAAHEKLSPSKLTN